MQVNVTVDGRVLRMSALKAMLMLEVRKALQGDGKASRFVLETFEGRGLGGAVKGSQDDLASWAAGATERLGRKLGVAKEKMAPLTPETSSTPAKS